VFALALGGCAMNLENIRKLGRDQQGLSTVEYTVLLVLIVAVSVGIWNKFGDALSDKLDDATTHVDENIDVTFK